MTKIKITIKYILKTINDNIKLKSIFYFKTNNRKYNIKYLLTHVLFMLKSGISYRMLNQFPNINHNTIPHWATIYKFFKKLIKYDIIENTFKQTVKKYLLKSNNNIFLVPFRNVYAQRAITDTTLIANKGGIDKKSYNPQLLKHKSSKISVITDVKGKPLDLKMYSSNIHDSKILNLQLDNSNFYNNDNNIMLGDSGYDSNIIKEKLKEIKFGKLLTPKNIRNCKNPEKLKTFKLSDKDKCLLKKRIKVENFFAQLKTFKRINIRYDKSSKNYFNYVLLAAISFY